MKKLLPLGLVLATALSGTLAHATSATWNSTGTDGNWFTAGDWTPTGSPGSAGTGTITNADTATFNSASNSTTIAINGTALNIKGITFDTNAAAYTIGSTANSGNSILLTNAGTIQIASTFAGTGVTETINAPLVLEGATATTQGSYTISNANTTASNVLVVAGNITSGTSSTETLSLSGANTGANTISGAISNGSGSGALSVSKTLAGTWTLSGNNSYTGSTTVSNTGTLVLSGNNSSMSGGVGVNNGSTLDVNNANALGSGTLSLGNGSSFDNTTSGAITNAGNNAITVANGFTFKGTNSLNLGTGAVSYTANAGQSNTWIISASTLTIGGNITGAGTIQKQGAGTLALSGNNSAFTGGFTLGFAGTTSSGTLAIDSTTALGTGTLTIDAGSGGIATIDNTSAGAITNAGNNVQIWDTSFTFAGTQSLNMGTGTVNLNVATATITTAANNLTIGGVIGSATSSNQLVKAGSGTLTLTGASTFAGATTVTGGVLVLGNTTALTGTIVLNGGSLDLATDTSMSGTDTVSLLANSTISSDRATASTAGITQALTGLIIANNTLTVTKGANVSGGTPIVGFTSATLNFGNTVGNQTAVFNPTTAGLTVGTITGSMGTAFTNTLDLDGTSSNNSVTGAITAGSHGTLSLLKSNSSTWNLGGTNLYTGGTTVSGGTLVLTGSTASSGTFTVGGVSGGLATASLSGTGTLNGLLVTSAANSNVAHIAPGATAGTVGTLHVGSLGFSVGAGTQFDYDITSSTTNDDLITLTGGVLTIGGSGIDFNFNQLSTLTAGTAYTLISGATSVSGFSASDFTATGDTGYTATFANTGTGITVTFTATGSVTSNSYYFTGTNSGTFTDAGNYFTAATGGTQQSTALSSSSNVFLNASAASTTDTLNTSASINSLNFVTAGTSLNGTGTLTLAATGTAGITDSASTAGQVETVAPAVILGSNQSWVATANSTLNVTGNVSGAQTLALTGNGTYKLGGANTFQGLTVGAGTDTPTLYLTNGTNGSATGTTTLRVNAGATLAGNGTSSGTSFTITGTSTSARANILVGLTSATDTTVGNKLTLIGSTGTSTLADVNLTYNISATSTASNQLSVSTTNIAFGTDAKGSVLFTLNLQGEPAIVPNGTLYTLIAGTSSSNQYSGLTLGNVINLGGGATETIITGNNLQVAFGNSTDTSYYGNGSYLVLYQSAGVDDIDVVVVPEPGTWAMMLGGLALLVVVQRARRKNS